MTKKFFTNCLILNPADKTCMKGSVLVDGTVISAVGADLQEPSDAEVIDLQGMTLMPGLFNCHTHLTNGCEAVETEAKDICQYTMQGVENLKKFVTSGVTFIRDVGSRDYIDIDIRNEAKKGRMTAPDMVVSGRIICMTGGHGWTTGRQADGVDECRKAAREQMRAGADWLKVMATGGVMTKGVEPGSPQLNEDELHAVCEEAHKAGMKVATHAQGMTGIKNALRAGVDSIEHGFYMDEWCFDWMRKHNVFYVPTLSAMYWLYVNGTEKGVEKFVMRKVYAAYDAHRETFKKAYLAGVKIACGTDAGTPFNYHDKTGYELVLMNECGMDPWDALASATVNAAELCGVSDSLGVISEGRRANLAVFASNPAENIHAIMDCRMTVIGGEIKYKA